MIFYIFSAELFLYLMLCLCLSLFLSNRVHLNFTGKLYLLCIRQNCGLFLGSVFGLFLNFSLYKLALTDSFLAIPGSVFVCISFLMVVNIGRAIKEYLHTGTVSITYLKPLFYKSEDQ